MKGSDYQRIAVAIRYLEKHAETQPSLDKLAKHLGLSEYHLHRLFKRWVGVTPKDFIQVLTLSKAKRLLAESKSLLETSLAVGLSGTARLHDLFVTHEAMTPGEFKNGARGINIHWSVCTTPFGNALIAATDRGICAFSFARTIKELTERWPEATLIENARKIAPYAAEIKARMQGEPGTQITLVLNGSAFQVKIWKALLALTEGEVVAYGDLADRVGAPDAARAVGSAVGANPIGYLIPCHRVIKSTGVIGDYRWGSDRKQVLLAVEGARVRVRAKR